MIDDTAAHAAWHRAKAALFGSAARTESPLLLSVGAQPGAGKTRALQVVLNRLYASRAVVPVIGDELRKYHPDYRVLCASADPEVMPRETAELSGWLVGRALEHAARNGYSVVVEGTLRRPETTLGTIEQFAQAGAATHLVVLGVSPFDSWTGCIDRYLSALEAGHTARWTPLSAHDAGLAGTPLTLEAAAHSLSVHRLSIVDRAGTLHYDNTRGPDGRWAQPERAVAVLEGLRSLPGDPEQRAARISSLARRAEALQAPPTVKEAIAHARHLAQPTRSRQNVLDQLSRRSAGLAATTTPRRAPHKRGPSLS